MRLTFLFPLAIAGMACGAKSQLRGSPAPRMDAAIPPDAPTDRPVTVPDVPPIPLMVECGETRRTPTRARVEIRVRLTGTVPVESFEWTLTERPPTSNARLETTTMTSATMTPDRAGVYRLRLRIVDRNGEEATCELALDATPTPPTVECPPRTVTRPLVPVPVVASEVDDGTIVHRQWTYVTRPTGSAATTPSPSMSASTVVSPDIAGVYVARYVVVDDDGNEASCSAEVAAISGNGLRVEMFWRPIQNFCMGDPSPCGGSDVDLHLLMPTATTWGTPGDCYYANCTGSGLEFGSSDPTDNPRLDIDDVSGLGPENINIDRPLAATYRVGVVYFADHGDGPQNVTVRIYCGESVAPVETFGPITVSLGNDLWRVADVRITSAGTCEITGLGSTITNGDLRR